MNKIVIAAMLLLATSTFAQVDSDAERHYKQGEREAMYAVGFLAAGMIAVPVEEYLCAKFSVGPKTEATIKVVSGLVFGTLSLYNAGHAVHDFKWVGVKVGRDF
jgi:hypothetical protein